MSIDIDPETRYQTFEGWRATVEIGDSDRPQSVIAGFREELLDWTVDSLGITRLRLAVKSGYENSVDNAPTFLADNRRRGEWVRRWFAIENDDDDPRTTNPAGFQFAFMDHLMETVVLPLKGRLEAKGESLHLNLNYVDFGTSPFEHRDNPEEFAEFLLVVVEHLDDKYGVIPNSIEILEPDNDGYWSAAHVARAFAAAGDRLEAAGYQLEFIGPSNITVAGALAYAREMADVPGLDRHWKVLSYHRYGETDSTELAQLASLAEGLQMRTAMLEFMFATTTELHQDLTIGNVSSWEKFAILDHVLPDSTGRLAYRGDARLMAHYMRNIRPGAVRIGASSSRETFLPVAFEQPGGGQVLLVRAARSGRFTIGGLPSGTHDALLVAEEGEEASSVPLTLDAEGRLAGRIPQPGLLVVKNGG